MFRTCPLLLNEKRALEVSCPPKFDMLPTSLKAPFTLLRFHMETEQKLGREIIFIIFSVLNP